MKKKTDRNYSKNPMTKKECLDAIAETKKIEVQHTPLPWMAIENRNWIDLVVNPDGWNDNRDVVAKVDCKYDGTDNAAFIVLAVNSHSESLNCLKDAVSDLEAVYSHSKQYGGFVVSLGMWRRLTAMKQAIVRVEGL